MAVITDEALAAWREWADKQEDRCPRHGLEDPGDVLAKQVGGDHYKKAVQPWTIALDWGLDPWSHNVVKYILRFPYKNGKEDLQKIQHYVEFLLENYDSVKDKYYN